MARRSRPYPNIKSSVTYDVPLDDIVAIPFSSLKQKFTDFAETQNIDMKDMKITEETINGHFINTAGVQFDLDIKAHGNKSKLQGSISKEMDNVHDTHDVRNSANTFIDALFHG